MALLEVLTGSYGMTQHWSHEAGWLAKLQVLGWLDHRDHRCVSVIWNGKRTIIRFSRPVVCWKMGILCIILEVLL